ncbi:MAG: hypothetical protein A2653_02880 [Candidatus Zambryskibacteria bacterium RIFCSPHIGHO2_01_FULL_43_25]|uniref:Uncharacterized protein n=1 Tax=Candidatus Zambryskibacteria bacterium RIFCSPLOWO2_01_FULL_45_21 TaxID=1802761 RepID=A0A1G2U284_9BACT|nr:MAG: hypothetical protein A2653_02880 [Candidatus Zambryskibacteria bacterium RIFCSPHIGHO2_01_FULL_43_25]OHB00924.1 MAG: hypothetical protein A3E94_00080 [Candidatus Zambryskibacteria bacterium RIFCSPHIGHO2_12_FULL_44_12b]OHB02952.1 MAG: hypothetical protein A3B14_00725 [Candidatus Zambryskibacteria bacterium RIFCSPLOWO2_01_FULL_45_21]
MSVAPLLHKINEFILNPIIVLLFTVSLLLFFWGIFQFVRNTDNEEARSTGQRNMLWGIIGMFIMFAVFGVIRIILQTFGIDPATTAPFLFGN